MIKNQIFFAFLALFGLWYVVYRVGTSILLDTRRHARPIQEPLNSEWKQVQGDNVIYFGDENSFIQ